MSRVDYYHDDNAPHPESIVPAVSAVIFTDDRKQILLQERVDNGKWSLPGGQMEPGESVKQAIKREVKEETGIDVNVVKLIGVYSDPEHVIAYSDGEIRQQFSMCFLCKAQSNTISVSSESKRVTYVPIRNLDSLNLHVSQQIRIQDALTNQGEAFIK